VRRLLIAAGLGGLVYAALGLLFDPDVRLGGVLLFLIVVLVLHDAVWMPLVLGAGAMIRRFLPRRYRRIARLTLLLVAVVAVVGLPIALSPS
jgi:threonine/homoserine/homoserine lactone efflux protein